MNGESLKQLRVKINFTQVQMAEFLEISLRTYQNWEQDKYECPDYLWKLIAYKVEHEKLL